MVILHGGSPWAAEAQFQAGQAFEDAGDPARAREMYQTVLEKFADSKVAAQARARLEALKE